MKKHAFILGFNRTGTTFLLSLYHRLGFCTGFNDAFIDKIQSCSDDSHGGAELFKELKSLENIYQVEVIKHVIGDCERLPWEVGFLNAAPGIEPEISFDYKILTRRSTDPMINSSIRRVKLKEARLDRQYSSSRSDYASQLAFYKVNEAKLVEWMGDCIEVEFPRSVRDFDYLWTQLEPTLRGRVGRDRTKEEWLALADESYVTYG